MEEWSHLDSLWSVDEEIQESEVGPDQTDIRAGEASASASASATQQQAVARNKFKTKSARKNSNVVEIAEEEGVKKLDHNAKERIRRMKLNASYLALQALLPDSRRSKKKWTAPAIVDRVVTYIPELENEIESLRGKKENVQLQRAKENNPSPREQDPTISLNQVNQQEAIFQVCVERQEQEESQLTHLLECLESEGVNVKSASALDVSATRICHHLHIQGNEVNLHSKIMTMNRNSIDIECSISN
ncbi:transcription factor bHLH160-like protein [Salvia divinorum]|uniref:Transcription factor bHLH160-like protein n=1 Tax=Salvia divinorum TaxID=28513 RepID=A0ABD1G503_SALDI